MDVFRKYSPFQLRQELDDILPSQQEILQKSGKIHFFLIFFLFPPQKNLLGVHKIFIKVTYLDR